MSASAVILLWWIAFSGSHMLLSTPAIRRRLLATVGKRAFVGLYSAIAFATFIPLVVAYMRNRHAGSPVELLAALPLARELAIVLAAGGFALIAASFVQPSATGIDPRAIPKAHGITRVTRHPLFMGLALWGLAHLFVNRSTADLAFFGGFLAFSVAGAVHQDARKRSEDAGRLGPYLAETSLLPFAAVLVGRNRLVAGELPWRAMGLGAAVAIAVYLLHPVLFR